MEADSALIDIPQTNLEPNNTLARSRVLKGIIIGNIEYSHNRVCVIGNDVEVSYTVNLHQGTQCTLRKQSSPPVWGAVIW